MFRFQITQVAVLLGKSPATIRSWERKGLIEAPRRGGKRSFLLPDIKRIAQIAHADGRITTDRLIAIHEAVAVLDNLEKR